MNIGYAVLYEVPIMPKQPVKVYLSTPQREFLTKITEAEKISRSEFLRNAFLYYVAIAGTTPEALKEKRRVGKK